ncbi:uncharacterized protein LOC110808526 isoform X1 [Carica papaya]|uniref:uncharacterized protein LOC110808526 isoform X1 n=1 Tax=Carica papaya TaxID=3649 RepID=UPI000B8CE921|nr:uncharacterized protein LOC110808526 isoform X1 [Carica papaya]
MSDEGEKTCPLCAEEMDLTDQQLKPCKCGYEICVWCWHYIMDMAEKDDIEGLCPACRAPYDKEKIVGMASNCERLVAEINMERKKSQKAKNKSSDGRKQLSSVRVIQRNLVYIVGLPLNLADEDLLQRREYFGQYGRVLKVSMSRTAAGVIQQFPNNTCSVYITYAKEEEAVRCIQSVHGFVLDGRSLKACFGTTKYCHAWLRNVPCTNPDCLYLHEVGSQEDSFTKDEIISDYTRSRVQQITGATNNLQRRSGNVLPPPIDDYCNNSSPAKPIVKSSSSQNTASTTKGSPPNGSSGRSIALPAAASWGMRASSQPLVASTVCLNGLPKQKPAAVSGALPFSSAAGNTTQLLISHGDILKKPVNEEIQTNFKSKPESLKPMTQYTAVSEKPALPDGALSGSQMSCSPVSKYNRPIIIQPNDVNSFDHGPQPFGSTPIKDGNTETDSNIHELCVGISSLSVNMDVGNDDSRVIVSSNSHPDHMNGGLQHYIEQYKEPSIPVTAGKSPTSVNKICDSRAECDWRTDLQSEVAANVNSEIEEDILSFDSQRLKDPEVVNHSVYSPSSVNLLHVTNNSATLSAQHSEGAGVGTLNPDPLFYDSRGSDKLHLSNGYCEKMVGASVGSDLGIEHSFLLPSEGKGKQMERFLGDAESNTIVDNGESSIISNILSLDFDSWDESLASPQNLAKLLGETDRQTSSLKLSNSWKGQNNNQSRFSFARQEDSKNPALDVESYNVYGHLSRNRPFPQDFAENRDQYLGRLGISNGFSSSEFGSDNFTGSHSVFSSNKLSAATRAQISAPPGFSVPSRSPPPGFSSHDRVDQAFDTTGNRLLDSSPLLRNSYHTSPGGNVGGNGDIEFMDPAILAVGKGRLQGALNNAGLDMRSNYPPQLNAFENDARLQLLMQRSLSPHQNLRFSDTGNSFSSLNDSYGISSRLMDQSHGSNLSPLARLSLQQSRNSLISNGHWNGGWNEVQNANSMGVAELLRNERLGFNKFYSGYEESKFRLPSSGDLYNRTYGM